MTNQTPSAELDNAGLAACPLCGNRAFIAHGNAPSVNGYPVWCVTDRCLRLAPRETEAEAIAAWNTRHPQADNVLREALAAAYVQGASDVHREWQENPGDAPRGDGEFYEAGLDYADAAIDPFDSSAALKAPTTEPTEFHLGSAAAAYAVTEPNPDADYLICKGGAFYRPNAEGYTRNAGEAGRYTLEEAISHSHPNGPDGPRDGITYVHESEVIGTEPNPDAVQVGERVREAAAKVSAEWAGKALFEDEPPLFRDGARWASIHIATAIRAMPLTTPEQSQ